MVNVQNSNEISPVRCIMTNILHAVGQLLSQTNLYKEVDEIKVGKTSPAFPNSCIIGTAVGLLSQGKSDFFAINELAEDAQFYSNILRINKIPSESTFRRRLNEISEAALPAINRANLQLLSSQANFGEYFENIVPIDIDVIPLDNSNSKKEGVSRIYNGTDGYAPILACVGTEGYILREELRPGYRHGQKGTAEFLRCAIKDAKTLTQKRLLVRMNAEHDSKKNIGICYGKENRADFIIKRNPRREPQTEWIELAMENTGNAVLRPREGKEVYLGSDYRFLDNWEMRIVYEVTIRTMTARRQLLLEPDIEVATYWTSLQEEEDFLGGPGFTDENIVQAYHDYSAREKFHSQIKTDMDLERLPSGNLNTNKLVWALGMLAYNILQITARGN
jgi:hypothetical protein